MEKDFFQIIMNEKTPNPSAILEEMEGPAKSIKVATQQLISGNQMDFFICITERDTTVLISN